MAGNRVLYEQLNKDGLYTKSYEEFNKQFSTPEKLYTLYSLMKSDGLYTKPIEEFKKKYWEEPIKSTIKMGDTKVDTEVVKKIVTKAQKYGIDPYTALAIGYQETRFKDEYVDNPFNLLSGERLNPETADEDFVDLSMQTMLDKQKLATRLGKKTEADVLQAWNGYGKIDKNSFGREVNKIYGIDVSKEPIDMNKNPVYGKRVIEIRDNILKKDPDIRKLVDSLQTPIKNE